MSASSASILRNRPLPLARRHHHPLRQSLRHSSSPATATATARPPKPRNEAEPPPPAAEPDEQPALSRRFTAMAEDALAASPRRAAQIARENEFSADLKRSLEARISSSAADDFQPARAVAALPSFAPKHARDIASAAPWTGTESTHDGVLRMLVDAHKPLRRDLARKPAPSPAPVDPRPQRAPASQGQRIARAREKSAEYSLNKTAGGRRLTDDDDERGEMRQMFRERFGAGVATLQALSSLADEKIADARRRGQFDNLASRGKPLARDHSAESPFLDTTEYLLNRIIKRQDIVPPWIEKQQDVVRATRVFRERLRVEWRRHAARSIASAGGGLEGQCGRAQRYARGEERLRRAEERRKKVEMGEEEGEEGEEEVGGAAETGPMEEVFRDPEWEAAELSYHKLAIEDLNSKTRSYNLMAPELAKKPYFSLERELKNCFRDCAPVISGEIRDRATRPSVKADFSMQKGAGSGGILEKLGGDTAAVYDSPKPNYGFKEFWGDLWGRKKHAE